MDSSIFLARLLGIYLVIIGFFYLFRRQMLQKVMHQIFASEALLVFSGTLNLLFGLLILLFHHIWVWDWQLTITLLGYLIAFKGLTRLFLPRKADQHLVEKIVSKDNPLYLGMGWLIIGFFLIYEGFLGA